MRLLSTLFAVTIMFVFSTPSSSQDVLDLVEHGYAQNGEVKIHYVSVGEGPLVVMLHGFPDYWYTWREQMLALKDDFKVVAMDLRGYNKSDQPPEVGDYAMNHLMEDVIAVIRANGHEKATIVGHDWGGAIAWQLAINHPEIVERLIACNMTHPTGRSIASLKAMQENGNESYMDQFRKFTAKDLPASWLSGWVKDADAKKHYLEAFARSNVDCMINYYRANTKTKEQRQAWLEDPQIPDVEPVKMPVLMLFGTQDKYVTKEGLNDTWNWVGADLTMVTIPSAAHFVQQDAPELVSNSMRAWLLRDQKTVPKDHPLKDLSWMLGKWEKSSSVGGIHEHWKIDGNTFRGVGYQQDGDKNRVFEEIILAKIGDDIFYMPNVSENDAPVPFKMVEQEENRVVFENPIHDVPQRIEYLLKEDGKMVAVVGDLEGNDKIYFRFRKK